MKAVLQTLLSFTREHMSCFWCLWNKFHFLIKATLECYWNIYRIKEAACTAGYTNGFHVNTSTEWARCYNDVSVMENHHCALTYELLSKAKLLSHLDKPVQLVSLILFFMQSHTVLSTPHQTDCSAFLVWKEHSFFVPYITQHVDFTTWQESSFNGKDELVLSKSHIWLYRYLMHTLLSKTFINIKLSCMFNVQVGLCMDTSWIMS